MKKALFLLFLPLALIAQDPPSAVLELEVNFARVTTFQAEFEQVYTSASMSIPLHESGHILFKKPDLMKWEYREPEEKLFLSKDGLFQYFIPEDNQLIRGTVPREGHEGEILLILSGQKKISEAFSVEIIDPEGDADPPTYKLTPREEGYYSHHHLVIDNKSGLIRSLTLFDWMGNSTEIRFSKIQTGVILSGEDFRLDVPEDVEIIDY